MNRLETVDIQRIRVHRRVRKEIGDIQPLMESIRAHGLLNPLIVTPEYELIAGQRRLESVKRLGWKAVQCRIVNPQNAGQFLQIEIEENTARKDFSSDELADALVRLDRLRNPPWWRRIRQWFGKIWSRITTRRSHRNPPRY